MTDDAATDLCIWVGLCLIAVAAIWWLCYGLPFIWGALCQLP